MCVSGGGGGGEERGDNNYVFGCDIICIVECFIQAICLLFPYQLKCSRRCIDVPFTF